MKHYKCTPEAKSQAKAIGLRMDNLLAESGLSDDSIRYINRLAVKVITLHKSQSLDLGQYIPDSVIAKSLNTALVQFSKTLEAELDTLY